MMHIFINNMYNNELFSLFMLALFISASYGAGYLFNRYILKFQLRNAFSEIIINIALGFNLLALLTLFLGYFSFLNVNSIWILLSIFALGGCLNLASTIKKEIIFFRKNITFCIILIGVAFFTLGSALCLPYIWDELTYHIAVPFRWINAGSLTVFRDNAFSGFPALPQLLFRLGCQNGGILFPRLLVWITYLLLFAAIYSYFKIYTKRFIVIFATIVFIANPLLINMMRSTYVEVFIMLNMLASLLVIRETKKSWKTIFICGILSGGIIATKLTGIGVAAIVFIFLWAKYHKTLVVKPSSLLIFFTLGGICIALPFYLRPWILTGNPFYPFLASFFGGSEAEILVAKCHYLMGSSHFGLDSILGFFTVFILIAFDGKSFDGMILGWSFLALLCLAIYWFRNIWNEERKMWRTKLYLPLAIFFYYVFWFITSQQTRFLQPLLFLVLMASIQGIRMFESRIQKKTIIILIFIWTGCFLYPPAKGYSIGSSNYLAVRHFYRAWRSLQYFPKQNVAFLKMAVRDYGYIESMLAIADKTPPDSKIMLLYERRGLYCPRPYVIGTPFWQAKYNTPLGSNPEVFYNSLIKNKVQYILLGGSNRNPDELGGEYLTKKEELINQIKYLVSHKKLKIINGYGNYFLCKVL